MAERRTARVQHKVVHRHRVGGEVSKRVSEFVFLRGQPKAILRWIDVAGVRTPLYVDLDPAKLRRVRAGTATLFVYEGTTVDPASVALDAKPPMRGRRRSDGVPLPGGRRRTDPPLQGSR